MIGLPFLKLALAGLVLNSEQLVESRAELTPRRLWGLSGEWLGCTWKAGQSGTEDHTGEEIQEALMVAWGGDGDT